MKHNPVSDVLERLGLSHWRDALPIEERLSRSAHGDMPRWLDAVERLPSAPSTAVDLSSPAVCAEFDCDQDALRSALGELKPWRKGPFRLGGVDIDTEWRSDLKWSRLENGIQPLHGRRVLDVGAGNGYFGFRMLGAGADTVLGVDPTLLFVAQFEALSRLMPTRRHALLPFRLEELPPGEQSFDSVFSMGVLYHQRSPIDHLRLLREHLAADGELVLETLILPGEEAFARTPPGRYARMRNVWALPTVAELEIWLSRSGYRDVSVLDVTATSTEEQRTTEWMEFESLREALDPDDSGRTVEGWPAPLRATLTASGSRSP